MSTQDYVRDVVAEVAEAFQPLAEALAEPGQLATYLSDLGWELDVAAATSLIESLTAVGQALTGLADDAAADADLETLASDVIAVATALAAAIPAVAAGPPAPLDNAVFWASLPGDLIEQLLFEHLDGRHPLAFGLMALLGVTRVEHHEADDSIGRTAYDRRCVDLESFISFVSDPAEGLRQRFGWGTDAFDHDAVLWALDAFLRGLQASTNLEPGASALVDRYFDLLSEHRAVDQLVISAPPLTSDDGVAVVKAALIVLPVPPVADRTDPPEGLVLLPMFLGQVATSFSLGPAATLALSGSATDTPIELFIRPSGVSATVSVAGVEATLIAQLTIAPVTPLIIVGAADSSRLELLKAHLKLQIAAGPSGITVDIEAVFDQLRLVVKAGEGDGFLRQVLGDKPIQVDVGPGLAWSSRTGLRFAGQSALALDIPLDVSLLGVLDLTQLHLAVKGSEDSTARIQIGISGGLSLGPFSASVENMGVQVSVRGAAPADPGNLGVVDLGFGFKPPSGVGLAIDTPAVRGGGFLSIDPDAGQYAGVFELTIVGTVSVKAIAIISTKLPDGQAGFALLILITAEGFTPIQLGLGFSLTGIGGLLALNRTVNVDVVRNGLRDGVLDSILFVKDPVKNAPRIISTLNRVFPIATGRLVVGPLAEISWGTPPLVKIRLALLLEIPQPIRVVLLAQLRLVLPNEKAPVVVLNVDAVGALDFGKGELSLDASIHDSSLLKFALSGDLALRLSWGDQPTFLMSVGGFHPKFPSPKGLRPLERLSLTLSDSENPRIRFETYLALTSNSIQMGAKVSVYATAYGFGIDGGGSFDALIQWSPFSLDVSLQAWVRVFGPTGTLLCARLALQVTGPEPWHLTGVAELSVLSVKVPVGVDFRTGNEAAPAPVETVDVAAAIWAEISRPESWQAALPATQSSGATLTKPQAAPAAAAPLVVHPLALLVGRQRVAPLDRPVSRLGAHRPTAGTRSYPLQVNAAPGVRIDPTTELFASAQFADLTDDAALSSPSFEAMTAGATLSGAAASAYGATGLAGTDLSVETLEVTGFDDDAVSAGAAVPLAVA